MKNILLIFYQEDIEAAKKLVLSHLRFVIHVARGYSGYDLPQTKDRKTHV